MKTCSADFFRRISLPLAAACLVAGWAAWIARPAAQQRECAIVVDADDIGGVVTGTKGPEADVKGQGLDAEPLEFQCHEGNIAWRAQLSHLKFYRGMRPSKP